jgi:uncharacterized RDD family membrane protein YckC
MAYATQAQHDPTAVLGRRIVAYILDGLLTIGVLVAVLAISKHQFFQNAPDHACQTLRDTRGFSGQCIQFGSHLYAWNGNGVTVARVISFLVGFVDLVVLQGLIGASIGKLIVGLRVVNAQGEPCGFGRAFVRWLFLLVDGACFLIGLIVVSVTHPHRRVGDMVANTYVIGLADVGHPVQGTPSAPQYAYAQPGAPGWAPPGSAAPPPPAWGATPPSAWGAPTDAPPPSPPTWGAPTPPPAATTPPPDQPGWGAPPPTWGTTPPDATPPPPAPPAAPTPPPPAPPEPPNAEPETPAPAAAPPDPPPAPPAEGESWWSKAFDDDDEPEK